MVRALTVELDRRLVSAADALHRRDSGLDRDDLRQLAREHALIVLAKTPDATESYVVTAARWRILDAYRAERRRSSSVTIDDVDEPAEQDFSDDALSRLGAAANEHLLAVWLLPRHQRDVILLLAEGFSAREVAVSLGVPKGTVTSRTARARESLLTAVAIVALLPAEQRAVLALLAAGLSAAEVGARLQIPKSTVASRTARARRELRAKRRRRQVAA